MKLAMCPLCGKRMTVVRNDAAYETARVALVEATRKGGVAALEQAVAWHSIVHQHLWRGHYDSAKAMLTGELQKRGLPVPKPVQLSHAYRVAQEFGTSVPMSWTLLYRALLYWEAIGKNDYNRANPGGEIIRVPVLGAFQEKPLRECTEKEVDAGTRAANPSAPKPSDLSTTEIALQKVLQAGLAKLAGDDGKGSLQLKKPHGKLRVRLSLEMDVDRVGGLVSLLKRLT